MDLALSGRPRLQRPADRHPQARRCLRGPPPRRINRGPTRLNGGSGGRDRHPNPRRRGRPHDEFHSTGTEMIARLPAWAEPLVEASQKAGEDAAAALRLAEEIGRVPPQPGGGDTDARWAVLAAVSRENLTVGRVLEAH